MKLVAEQVFFSCMGAFVYVEVAFPLRAMFVLSSAIKAFPCHVHLFVVINRQLGHRIIARKLKFLVLCRLDITSPLQMVDMNQFMRILYLYFLHAFVVVC